MVLSLVSKKGGVGKSTSVLAFASTWLEEGHKVCIVDFDPDATLYKLSQKTDLNLPVLAGNLTDVKGQIEKLKKEYPHIVCDTAPEGEQIMRLSGVSDEVITPLSPSGFDLDRLQETIKIVEEVEAMRGTPLLSILITKYRSGVNRSDTLIEVLKQQELPVLDNRVRLLDRYADYGRITYTDEYRAILKELEIL